MFQRQRVDMLLGELMRKFPLPQITDTTANTTLAAPTLSAAVATTTIAGTSNANATTTTSTASEAHQNPSIPQTVTTPSANANGAPANNGNVDSRPTKIQRLA